MDKKPTAPKPKKKTNGLKLAIILGATIFLIAAATIGVFVAIDINRREQYADAQSLAQELADTYSAHDGASADTFNFETQKVNETTVIKNLEIIKSKRASLAEKIAKFEEKEIIKKDEEASKLLAELKDEYAKLDDSLAIIEESYSFMSKFGVFNDLPDFENLTFTNNNVKDAAAKVKAVANMVAEIPEQQYDANKEYIAALKTYYSTADTIWSELGSCIDNPRSCDQTIISQAEDPIIESTFMAASAKFQNYFSKSFDDQKFVNSLNAFNKHLVDKSNGE